MMYYWIGAAIFVFINERLDYILKSKVKFGEKEYRIKDIKLYQEHSWYDDPYNQYWTAAGKETIDRQKREKVRRYV